MSLIHFRHFRCPNQSTSIDHVAFFDFWPFLIFSTILQCCDPCYSDDRAEIDESSAYDASTSNLSSIECLHVCQIKLDHLQPHIHWHLKSINSFTKLSHCLQYLKMLQMQSCYMDLSKLLCNMDLSSFYTTPNQADVWPIFWSCFFWHQFPVWQFTTGSKNRLFTKLCRDCVMMTREFEQKMLKGTQCLGPLCIWKCFWDVTYIWSEYLLVQKQFSFTYTWHIWSTIWQVPGTEREWSIWRECFCFWQYFCDDHCQRPELKIW